MKLACSVSAVYLHGQQDPGLAWQRGRWDIAHCPNAPSHNHPTKPRKGLKFMMNRCGSVHNAPTQLHSAPAAM